MSKTPMVTFSSVDNQNTWNIEGESKCLVFASPSEAKRAEELFTAMLRALAAERERADRNQEDAERYRWLRDTDTAVVAWIEEDGPRWSIEGRDGHKITRDKLDAAIDAARGK